MSSRTVCSSSLMYMSARTGKKRRKLRKEKAEAGLAAAREQERQHTEEAGHELPRVQKPP